MSNRFGLPRPVHTQGHTRELIVRGYTSSCGDIVGGGVAFEFRGEGAWTIPLYELQRIVREAELEQAAVYIARTSK